MSGIFSILNITTNSLFASQTGVQVTSHNLANVNTPGYMRQTPVFEAVGATAGQGGLLLGRGVTVTGVRAAEAGFLDFQVNQSTSLLGRFDMAAQGTDPLQQLVNESDGGGLSSKLDAFFSSLNDLASDPSDSSMRTAVRGKAQDLIAEFHRIATGISDVRKNMNDQVKDDVRQVNQLAEQIADLNGKIATAEETGQSAADLRGTRTEAMKELAQYVDFHSSEDAQGRVTIYLAAGSPLVEGATHQALACADDPSNDDLSRVQFVDSNGNATDLTDQIQGGQIRGALDVRDKTAVDMQGRIDDLAHELATRVNAIHSTAYTPGGTTGINFFVDPGAVDGAAARIDLDPAILSDVNNIAAAQSSQPGDNRAALAMAGLQTSNTMDGGTETFTDFYSSLVGDTGLAAQQNTDSYDHQKTVTDQIVSYRESVAGVSIDEEMTNLLKYQQAYQASAKMINTVTTMLDTLVNLGSA